MKLQFKQQPYQTDATMAVVQCFEGQGKGQRKEVVGRMGFLTEEIFIPLSIAKNLFLILVK